MSNDNDDPKARADELERILREAGYSFGPAGELLGWPWTDVDEKADWYDRHYPEFERLQARVRELEEYKTM